MKTNRLFVLLALLGYAWIAGCGGSGNSSFSGGGGGTSSPVSVAMRDTPPAGVSLLTFEVTLIGATLNPGNVDLLQGKMPKIEVKRLEVETAYLSTNPTVTASSTPFTSSNLTFASPHLTFENNSNPPVTIAGCAPGAVCQINPTGILTATVNFASPLTVTANAPLSVEVDVNLNTLLTNALGVDFSVNGAVNIVQAQPQPGGELEDVDDLSGKVQNVSSTANTFDLATTENTYTGIKADTNTQFAGFDKSQTPCTANPQNFSCLANGQIVDVDMKLVGSTLLAKKIEEENEAATEDRLEGTVYSVSTTTNQFQIVVLENLSSLSTVVVGSPITVAVNPAATQYQVDQDGLNVDPTLVSSFNGIGSLQVGQNIQVRRRCPPTVPCDGSPGSPLITDRVRLRMSRFTAPVKAVSPSTNSFTVDTTSLGLFNSAGITQINVTTDPQRSQWEPNNVTLATLLAGDKVSLRGLLFQGSPPTIAVRKIRKQP